MVQDRTPQYVIWSAALTILCFVVYAIARSKGLAPVNAAVADLVVQCAILAGSLILSLRKQKLSPDAPRLSSENDFPRGPAAGLLPLIASAGLATPLCWMIFKLTGSGTFLAAGGLIMLGVILFSLVKDIDDQVKFGAIMACMLTQTMLIMAILA
jgi:hypothetical protein